MQSEDLPASTRTLKLVVIGLGIVFFVLLAVFVAGVATKFRAKSGDFTAALRLEQGEAVQEIAGAGDRLALRLAAPGGAQRILFVDPKTGRRLGTLDLVPAAGENAP